VARRIVKPDHTALDRAEFGILQLLRMGKADLTTVALILNKFEEASSPPPLLLLPSILSAYPMPPTKPLLAA
jgi:hypothetical protein